MDLPTYHGCDNGSQRSKTCGAEPPNWYMLSATTMIPGLLAVMPEAARWALIGALGLLISYVVLRVLTAFTGLLLKVVGAAGLVLLVVWLITALAR